MRKVGYLALAYALFNLALFSVYFTFEPPKDYGPSRTASILATVGIVFPIVYYFVSLYVLANREIKNGTASGLVVKRGYALAVAVSFPVKVTTVK